MMRLEFICSFFFFFSSKCLINVKFCIKDFSWNTAAWVQKSVCGIWFVLLERQEPSYVFHSFLCLCNFLSLLVLGKTNKITTSFLNKDTCWLVIVWHSSIYQVFCWTWWFLYCFVTNSFFLETWISNTFIKFCILGMLTKVSTRTGNSL